MPQETLLTRKQALQMAALAVLGVPALGHAAEAETKIKDPEIDRSHGLTLGVASISLMKQTLPEVIAALGKLRISYIDLYKTHCPWDSTPQACAAVGKQLADAGIKITGTGVINLPNKEDVVRKAFDNCKAAGASGMVAKPDRDALPLVDRMVKEYDLRVAIHNHGPEDAVYPAPPEIMKFLAPYDARIGLCLDVGHCMRAGYDPIEAIHTCKERLLDIHFKDSAAKVGDKHDKEVVVGHGHMDIRGMLEALIAIKYPYRVDFEYEQVVEDKLTGLAESIGYVRGILSTFA